MSNQSTISTRITDDMRKRIEKIISKTGLWLNESDFLRDVIREKLDELEALQTSNQKETD